LAVMDATNASRIPAGTVLTQMADKALYGAKQSGRNCVRMFSLKPTVGAA
jgi:PleD family two-component response regulator